MHKNRKTKTLMAVLMTTSMTVTSIVNGFSIVNAQENIKENPPKVVESNNDEKSKDAENNVDKKQESNSTVNNVKEEEKNGAVENVKENNNKPNEMNVTVNDAISVMVDYFNNDYYKKENGKLTGWEYASMKKAGADLSKWELDCAMMFYGSEDELKNIAAKAKQSIILMELDKDPTDYKGRNLIKEMADEMAKELDKYDGYICNELKAMLAIDEFNEKFKEKKVDYNVEAWINIVIGRQDEKEGNIGNITDTGYAIELLSRHEDIEGVKEVKGKALNYIKNNLHSDGGIYTRSFNHKTHAEIVRELIKAGEDPKAEQWIKTDKNIIDALFENWNGEKFVKNNGKDAKYDYYTEALYTLTTLKEKGYGDYALKGVEFVNLGKEDGNKEIINVEKITLDKTFIELTEGKTYQLEATITPENATDKSVEWSSSDENIARANSEGRVFAKKAGEAVITVTTEDGKKKASCNVKVSLKEWDRPKTNEEYEILIKETMQQLKGFYEEKDSYNYIQCMSLNLLGMDKNLFKNKFQLREDEVKAKPSYLFDKKVEMLAKNIMGIIAIGENPKDYKGINYIEKLKNCQNELGEFIIDESDINSQAYSIIALDMANEKYDVSNAIKILMEKHNTEDKINVENICNTIIALSTHGQEAEVEEFIKKCVKDIKELQGKLQTGGVAHNKYLGEDELPVYDAIAIQALISVGENPLSDEYKKDSKTILDGMMRFKKDNYFTFGKYKECYPEFTDEASGMALASLIDLNSKKSMYHLIGEKYKEQKEIAVELVKQSIENGAKEVAKDTEISFEFNQAMAINNGETKKCILKDNTDNKEYAVGDALEISKDNPNKVVVNKGKIEGGLKEGHKYTLILDKDALKAKDTDIVWNGTTELDKQLKLQFEVKKEEKVTEFEVTLVNPPKYFNLNEDASITAVAKNNGKEVQEGTLIIALYNEEGKMVNYSSVNKDMQPGETNKMTGGFTLPKEGRYKVRVFIWDSLKNMKPLSEVKEIEVK